MFHKITAVRWKRLLAGAFVLWCLALSEDVWAQLAPPRGAFRDGPAIPSRVKAADAAVEAAADLAEKDFPGGAALKTDPEQQRLLKRAEVCVADGRLDLAAVLWQKVLDEAGDTLMTRDGRTYTSLAEEVERTIVDPKLPKLTLATYRIGADGEAQALLTRATPDTEEAALATVVRRYFLSAHGDDAAYKLGCLALDRFDFVGASRLFHKILEQHPDPSPPRSEILLRLAVASARMGDRAAMSEALAALQGDAGPKPNSNVLALVEDDLARGALAAEELAAAGSDWHMQLGNPRRAGRMPGLPEEVTSRTLTELWVQEMPLALTPAQAGAGGLGGGLAVVRSGRGPRGNPGQMQPVSREQLVSSWRQNGWTPAQQLLFDSGRVYIKTPDSLVCYRTAATSDEPVWRSAWQNQYELDGMSRMQMMIAMNMGLAGQSSTKPRSLAEILLFGDRVHQSLSLAGGVLYSLEGKQVKPGERPQASDARAMQWGVTPRRTRTNWLAAYRAAGGSALWRRSASDEEQAAADVGFLAAPVPYGDLLLVPVTDGGTLWLHALAASTGKTSWKVYLCDEPSGGVAPWAPIVLAVDGRDAYLTCGTGVVFAVDAAAGAIRWAKRYERDGKVHAQPQIYGNQQPLLLDLNGWDDDVVIPHGRTLLILSSDCDQLLAWDRRNGSLLWASPRTRLYGPAASYCLGVRGQGLFVAGKNTVRRYDIPSGRVVWERDLDDSFGRGVLTDDAIYLPVNDSIVKLELEKGRELLQVGVSLTTDDPVGNLFSDGEKLWVTGGGRVYAMTNLEHRLEILRDQIAAGDAAAQLNRMRLYAKGKQTEPMLADLRGAYELLRQQESEDVAAGRLFAAMNELRLPREQPGRTLEVLADLFVRAASPPILSQEMLARRGDLIASTLHVVRQQKLQSAVPALLALTPLLDQDYLISSATQTLDLVATKAPAQVAALREAVESGPSAAQRIAAGALARVAPDEAPAILAKLNASSDDSVRLAAARALASLEDHAALDTLIALLDSPQSRVRARSHQTLRALTGQSVTFAAEGAPEARAAGVAAWKKWLAAEGASVKFKLPLLAGDVPLGRILFTSHVHGLAIELDAAHKEVWRQAVPNPWGCQGLPNGHRLISAYSQRMVIEYDDAGREVWRKENLPGPPYSVQRLENGNTLVACADVQKILEIAPDGTTTSISMPGRPMFAHRLENGNTLIALQQGSRVVEIDSTQKIVWEARNMNGACSATRLENGNTLIVQQFAGQVCEVDPSGQRIVWNCKVPLTNPMSAQRLASGNTLISDNNGIREIDPRGEEVRWHHPQQHVSGVSSY